MSAGGFAATCRELLAQGLPVRFRAGGSSMEPTIHDGDLVTVEPLRSGSVARGDVVLYVSGGRLFAHRVREISPDRTEFVCRGDCWGQRRENVASGTVIGRVVAVGSSGAPPAGRSDLRRGLTRLRAALARVIRRLARCVALQ